MVEIQTVTVQLGDREYLIQQAGFLRSKPWKKRLLADVKPLFDEIGAAQGIEFASPADVIQLLPLAEKLFIEAIDLIFELLVAYSPVLEDDRAYIEQHATDMQIFAAFQEVVKLADFFGITQQINRNLGLTRIGTFSNSR